MICSGINVLGGYESRKSKSLSQLKQKLPGNGSVVDYQRRTIRPVQASLNKKKQTQVVQKKSILHTYRWSSSVLVWHLSFQIVHFFSRVHFFHFRISFLSLLEFWIVFWLCWSENTNELVSFRFHSNEVQEKQNRFKSEI